MPNETRRASLLPRWPRGWTARSSTRPSIGQKSSSDNEEHLSTRQVEIMNSVIDKWKGHVGSNSGMVADHHQNSVRQRRLSWSHALIASDPRRMIHAFFGPGDQRGPLGLIRSRQMSLPEPPGSTSFFTVWRPTSLDAIRMMMSGQATGKGMNIKGKSAKRGQLSGFVPFLQISEAAHKSKLSTSPSDAQIRVWYTSESARDRARLELAPILHEMDEAAKAAKAAIAAEEAGDPDAALDDDTREAYLLKLRWIMDEPELVDLDGCGPDVRGLEMPERLLVEAYIMRPDISHPKGWETGRPSEPDYMDLNLRSTRHFEPDQPLVVCYQLDADNPLNPRGLLVAYEERDRVLPVASDFDAFLIGSKDLNYPTVPTVQLPFIHSLIRHIEEILQSQQDAPSSQTWTHRWLSVLKGDPAKEKRRRPARKWEENPHGSITDLVAVQSATNASKRRPSLTDLSAVQSVTAASRRPRPSLTDMEEVAQQATNAVLHGGGNLDSIHNGNPPISSTAVLGSVDKARRSTVSGSLQHGRVDGRFGFGDEMSRSIIEHACARLNGAVRHAAESFNYYWPQELDDEYLVVWGGFGEGHVPWKYMSQEQLRHFLLEEMVPRGYAFPLSPKWILCDKGWYEVYKAMEAKGQTDASVRQALDAWLPRSSGLRERIEEVHAAFPEGFTRTVDEGSSFVSDAAEDDMTLVELRLHRQQALFRAKAKLRAALMFVKIFHAGRAAAARAAEELQQQEQQQQQQVEELEEDKEGSFRQWFKWGTGSPAPAEHAKAKVLEQYAVLQVEDPLLRA